MKRATHVTACSLLLAACTQGQATSDSGPWWTSVDPSCGDHRIDGAFGDLGGRCAEWAGVEPLVGRFGNLYVSVDGDSRLVVLNDWHLRDDAPAEPDMYNLFCLATEIGTYEIRVYGDQHVEAWLNGEPVRDIEGASGFGASPRVARPHSIFEFRLGQLPTRIRILECDPPGGRVEEPALPPDVQLASRGTCFPGSAPDVRYSLVREPSIFEVSIAGGRVATAGITRAPALFGVQGHRAVAGQRVEIYGAQLGAAGRVFLGDRELTVTEWTDERVTVEIPDGTVGELALRVEAGGSTSNLLPVRVAGACVPSCSGVCGDDGCGGSCGACAEGTTCDDASKTCVPETLD